MASDDPTNDENPAPTMEGNTQEAEGDGHTAPSDGSAAAAGKSNDDGVHEKMSSDAKGSGGGGIGAEDPADADVKPAQNQKQKQEEEDAALARMMAFQEEQEPEAGGSTTTNNAAVAENGGGGGNNVNDVIENINLDPNVAFLGEDPAADEDANNNNNEDGAAIHPNLNNPAAIALRARQAQQNALRLNPNGANAALLANQPFLVRKLFSILQPSLRYTPLSLAAAGLLLHHTLRTRQQFYLALVYLQSSKLAYILLGNAVIALAVSTYSLLTKLFLDGGLRPNERDAIGEHIRWDVTETCLALTIFRSELDVVTAIMFLGLVIMKCLHWSVELRGGHLRMTEEVFVYPDEEEEDDMNATDNTQTPRPKQSWYRRIPHLRLTHIRYYMLVQVLIFLDIFAVAHCALSVATHGPSVDILFGFESAILLISGLSSMGSYHLHVIDGLMGVLHHLAEGEHHHVPVGGMAEVNENEGSTSASAGGSDSAVDVGQPQEGGENGSQDNAAAASTADRPPVTRTKTFAKTMVERVANPWRDRRATLSFAIELQAQAAKFLFYVVFFAIVFTYYGMPINIFREVYVSFQQLRRRLIAFNTYRRLTHNMDTRFESIKDEEELDRLGHTCIICRDTMDCLGGCKKLPGCGHAFHTHCLREWLVQQQTCPTCRADIAANEKKVAAARRAQERQQQEEGVDPAAAAGVEGDANGVAAAAPDGATQNYDAITPQERAARAAARQQEINDIASQPAVVGQKQTDDKDNAELPSGWTTHIDKRSGRTYYYNRQLGQSSWSRPISDGVKDDQRQSTETKPNVNNVAGIPTTNKGSGQGTTANNGATPDNVHDDQDESVGFSPLFPCLYRVKSQSGSPVYLHSHSPHLNDNLFGSSLPPPKRTIPCGKLIVCTIIEYWPGPFQQAMLGMPDGYVRSVDVERFLSLDSRKGVEGGDAKKAAVAVGAL